MRKATNIQKIFAKRAAVLVVDVQAEFCDPKGRYGDYDTDHAAKKIQHRMPALRRTGVKSYAIYFSRLARPTVEDAGFFRYKPKDGDIVISKKKPSAFTNKKLQESLEENKVDTVFVFGVNYNVCVAETALAAKRRGLNVYVVDDLTANGYPYTYQGKLYMEEFMKKKGIKIVTAAQALKMLK